MWVKICANTNLEDAALAIELGADAVGFVFAKSRRQVTVPQVAAITRALPDSVERIGVFDSADASEIAAAVWEARLSAAQLHRGYDEALVARLSEMLGDTVGIIPTLHWSADSADSTSVQGIAAELEHIARAGIARRVLVDSKVSGISGGTGVRFDWVSARQVFSEVPKGLQLILAGGLNAANVGKAIRELNPAGVDVASGVEASAGKKDRAHLASFIRAARYTGTP